MATARERVVRALMKVAFRSVPSDPLIDLLIERGALHQVGWCYRPEQPGQGRHIAFYGLGIPGIVTGEPMYVREVHD